MNDIAKPEPVDSVSEDQLAIRIPKELDPLSGSGNVWTSITPKSDIDRARIMTALQGQVPKLGEHIGELIFVENVALQSVECVNKNSGEVIQAVRTVLFCTGGKMFGAVSDGVRASVGMACKLFGYPPWIKPIPFRIKQIETGRGRRFYVLNVDEEALAQRDKKK